MNEQRDIQEPEGNRQLDRDMWLYGICIYQSKESKRGKLSKQANKDIRMYDVFHYLLFGVAMGQIMSSKKL